MKPRLAFRVDNKLQRRRRARSTSSCKFKHIDDFEPEQVVRQVEPLRKLLEARQRLSELMSKMDGNDKLEELLQEDASTTPTC